MWFYRCIFILFPYIVNCLQLSPQDNVQVQTQSGDPELVFTDVIKNISRVNNVLEQLINNYEQLKKLYKSQENSETKESDTEIDEVFKAKERKNKGKTTQKPPHMGGFPATQMFYSNDEDNSNSANIANKKSNENVAAAKDTAKNSSENSSSDQSTFDSSDTSSEKERKNSNTEETKPALRIKSEILLIDVPKTTKNMTEVKQNMMKSILKVTSKAPKIINVKDKTTNNTKNVHKVVHAESFSKHNIWNEILNNKPIQLQKSHIVYDLPRKPGNVMKQAQLRSSDSKGVQVNNNDKKINDNRGANFYQTEDEIVIQKEQFKTDVLRTAYGDACLKLVLTKCNRACTAAAKTVCRKHNCKPKFNDKYKSAARKGCRKEFFGEDPSDNDDETDSNKQYLHYRGEQKKQQSDKHESAEQEPEYSYFVDMTRGGYLSGACLPPSQDKVEPPKPGSLRNNTQPAGIDMTFNVLRDKYENACKRVSAGKCKKACSYAYDTACKDTCNKDKKNAFKKACPKECNSAYKLSDGDSGSDYY